jgi:hypothetical protein
MRYAHPVCSTKKPSLCDVYLETNLFSHKRLMRHDFPDPAEPVEVILILVGFVLSELCFLDIFFNTTEIEKSTVKKITAQKFAESSRKNGDRKGETQSKTEEETCIQKEKQCEDSGCT